MEEQQGQEEHAGPAAAAPKKKFYTRWWFWTAAALVVLLAIGASGGSSAPSASVPAAPDTSAAAAEAPAAAPAQAAAPQTLLSVSGSGTKTTQKFTAAGDWDLSWSYDCSGFGYKGNFQVFVYNGDGSISLSNQGVNQLGMSGSDVEHFHAGGTFYLEVNSECDWKIGVQG